MTRFAVHQNTLLPLIQDRGLARDWARLLDRADNLPRQPGQDGLGDGIIDADEARRIVEIGRQAGTRVLPAERALASFLSKLTGEPDKVVEVRAPATEKPSVSQGRSTEPFPLGRISGSEWDSRRQRFTVVYADLAARLIATRAAGVEGPADALVEKDLDGSRVGLMEAEISALERLRDQCFPFRAAASWTQKAFAVPAYSSKKKGITVTRQQTDSWQVQPAPGKDEPSAYRSSSWTQLLIKAPAGMRVLADRNVWTIPGSGEVLVSVDQHAKESRLVFVAAGGEAGLPKVVDAVVLKLLPEQ